MADGMTSLSLAAVKVCVDGYLGDEEGAVVIFSKNASSCFNDNALCNVSSGLMGGTPAKPSRTISENNKRTKW